MNVNRAGAVTSISSEQIELMPSVSRSMNDIMKLTPQASTTTSGLAIGGGNYRQSYVTVDGAAFNNAFGIGGNLAAVILAAFATAAFCFWCARDLFFAPKIEQLHLDRTEIRRYFVSTFWFQLFLLLMANGDVLLIKTFAADPAEVGIYSSGSVIGKISLYLANAIVPVLLPMVAERQSTGHDTRQLLKRAMLWGGGVAMLCAVGMYVVGRPMIGLLFGERYLAAIDLLLPISFYVVPVACLTILINYLMPLGRSGFFAVSMAAGYLLIFVLVSRFHHSVAQMLYIMGGGLLLVLAANLIYIALAPQKEKATV